MPPPSVLCQVKIDARSANSDTFDAENDGSLAPFNPFTETPVRGVNYELGDDFGQADEADDFQQPRTFRFSVGFRF